MKKYLAFYKTGFPGWTSEEAYNFEIWFISFIESNKLVTPLPVGIERIDTIEVDVRSN